MKEVNKPLVSVVIPVYNCARTVGQSIDSALGQDVSLEVLVIDDRSSDELPEVLKKYESEPRVRCLINEENAGVAYSRNRGIYEAEGEYIAFLDADDWWEPGKLKHQLKVMKRTGAVLSCTARELVDSQGAAVGRTISVKNRITYLSLLAHNSINCSSVVVKTAVAREFPMEHDDSHEDYILWLRILRKYRYAAGINVPYLKYRLSEDSKSGNKWKSARMTYQVYRYMGYNVILSACFFLSYSLHGVWKYYIKKG